MLNTAALAPAASAIRRMAVTAKSGRWNEVPAGEREVVGAHGVLDGTRDPAGRTGSAGGTG